MVVRNGARLQPSLCLTLHLKGKWVVQAKAIYDFSRYLPCMGRHARASEKANGAYSRGQENSGGEG